VGWQEKKGEGKDLGREDARRKKSKSKVKTPMNASLADKENQYDYPRGTRADEKKVHNTNAY